MKYRIGDGLQEDDTKEEMTEDKYRPKGDMVDEMEPELESEEILSPEDTFMNSTKNGKYRKKAPHRSETEGNDPLFDESGDLSQDELLETIRETKTT